MRPSNQPSARVAPFARLEQNETRTFRLGLGIFGSEVLHFLREEGGDHLGVGINLPEGILDRLPSLLARHRGERVKDRTEGQFAHPTRKAGETLVARFLGDGGQFADRVEVAVGEAIGEGDGSGVRERHAVAGEVVSGHRGEGVDFGGIHWWCCLVGTETLNQSPPRDTRTFSFYFQISFKPRWAGRLRRPRVRQGQVARGRQRVARALGWLARG